MGTFLGTFVYALSALLLLGFEGVARSGVSLLFLGALLMMLNAVRYLVQWIHHVAEILKINHTLHRVHRQAVAVLDAYLADDAPKSCAEVATPSGEALPRSGARRAGKECARAWGSRCEAEHIKKKKI